MPAGVMNDDMDEQLRALNETARDNGIIPPAPPNGGKPVVLGASDDDGREQLKLPTDNRELHHFARDVGRVCCHRAEREQLFEGRPKLFRRDMQPVIVNAENKRLDAMTSELFRTWASQFVACYREKMHGDYPLRLVRTMNLDTARGSLESHELLLQCPRIDRVNETRLPVITNEGRIELLRHGYFGQRGIYTFDDGLVLDEAMSLDEARRVIDDLLQYFPFPNGRSKAVTVAGMLTMFCATMLPKSALRPGFIFTANSPGAGKTLLSKICIIPVAGTASTRTFPRKEEAKKVLDIIAMDAASYVLFDNIRGKIAGEEIEAFITSPVWEGRILGESSKFRVDNVATIFLTGNQSTTSADMADRCLFVELFVQEADNRDRKIPSVIDDAALIEMRPAILSALWAFVRAWDAADRPRARTVMPRFEAWANIVAAIVLAAGYGDPVERGELIGLGDRELADMRELVQALAPSAEDVADGKLTRVWKFAEIVEQVVELGLFGDEEVRAGRSVEPMFDDNGITPAGKSHFGKLLGRYDRRLFGTGARATRFIVEGKGNGRRFVVEVEPQSIVRAFDAAQDSGQGSAGADGNPERNDGGEVPPF